MGKERGWGLAEELGESDWHCSTPAISRRCAGLGTSAKGRQTSSIGEIPKELDHGPRSCGATLAEPGNKKSLANHHFGNRFHSAQTVS